jgi:hypothetical protein
MVERKQVVEFGSWMSMLNNKDTSRIGPRGLIYGSDVTTSTSNATMIEIQMYNKTFASTIKNADPDDSPLPKD